MPRSFIDGERRSAIALDARIALMCTAQRSLDVQYCDVAGDNIGRAFLRELRDASNGLDL